MSAPVERESDLVLDRIPGLSAVLDRSGRIRHAGRALLAYCEATVEELENWTTNGIVHPDDVARAVERLAASVREGASYQTEQRLRRSDGAYRWFRTDAAPFRGTDGDVECWYVLLVDVDDLMHHVAECAWAEANPL